MLGASLDVSNRGVAALGVSLAGLIAGARPGADVAFHYSNATGGTRRIDGRDGPIDVEVLNCRMSPSSAPSQHILVILVLALLHRIGLRGFAGRNPWVRSLLAADVIGDVRGGDSFSDIYGWRRFVEGSLPLISVALLGRPYVLLPQTYGPFRRRTARVLARQLLRRAELALTRDRNCERLVEELSGRTPRFCPDVAFTLEPVAPRHLETVPAGFDLGSDDVCVGVNISGLLDMGGYTSNMFGLRCDYPVLMERLVDRLLTATRARILLVPHEFGEEREQEACSKMLRAAGARHPGRVFMVAGPLSERELKWVIGRTDFFIGSRMHACIAALSQGVPAVGLAYSDKFLGVFQSAGVGQAIVDLRVMDLEQVIEATLSAFDRRAAVREELVTRIPSIQRQVRDVFAELVNGWRPGSPLVREAT